MARIRSVKPEVRRSLTVASWPFEVRLAWVYLWMYLDDEGRGLDDMRLIVAECFPLDRNVTEKRMNSWLTRIAETVTEDDELPPLCRYQVAGRRYLHATKWQHQRINRPQPSRLPACPIHERSLNDSLNQTVNGPMNETRNETVNETLPDSPPSRAPADQGAWSMEHGARERKQPPRERGTHAPDHMIITDTMRQWAATASIRADLDRETTRFLDHARANGKTFKDWTAAWRTWMGRADDFAAPRNPTAKATINEFADSHTPNDAYWHGYTDQPNEQTS